MKPGEAVKVFRAGHPEDMREARVILASSNLNSLALALGETGLDFSVTLHPEHGVVLCLLRDEETHPFWCDLFAGDKFGIVTGLES